MKVESNDWDSGFRIQVTVPDTARGRPLDITLAELRVNLEGALDDPRMHQSLANWLAGNDEFSNVRSSA